MPRQRETCAWFGLTPRAELHITLGYIGDAQEEQLAALARELAGLAREPFGTLALAGTGGAVLDERVSPGHVRQLTPEVTSTELEGRSRVLWWAVEPNEALSRARNVLREAIRCVGLSDKFLQVEFYPHVTLGSQDPRDWDVHGVPKLATLGRADAPATVAVQRFHITRTDLHPQSLHIIAEYGYWPGPVVWLTGWPASGKSTLAREVRRRLVVEDGIDAILLDSDEVRNSVYPWLGYSVEDRRRVYTALIGLAGLLASQGHVVLVPATAPRRAMRDEARSRLPRFIEVFVSTPKAECAARDPKGIYGDGLITFDYEPPLAAEVTTAGATDETGLARILELIRTLRGA